jgi:uncharacterized protein (TIGR02118 family)
MIKRMSLLVRRPEIDVETFARHWREIHGPLATPVPNVLRYVQNRVVEDYHHPRLASGGHQVDGIVEFLFPDRAAMDDAFASPQAATLFADGAEFIQSVTSFIVDEHVVIDRSHG